MSAKPAPQKRDIPVDATKTVAIIGTLMIHASAAGVYPPIWAVPVLVAVMFAAGFAVWLVLRRIPVVNRYLI